MKHGTADTLDLSPRATAERIAQIEEEVGAWIDAAPSTARPYLEAAALNLRLAGVNTLHAGRYSVSLTEAVSFGIPAALGFKIAGGGA